MKGCAGLGLEIACVDLIDVRVYDGAHGGRAHTGKTVFPRSKRIFSLASSAICGDSTALRSGVVSFRSGSCEILE